MILSRHAEERFIERMEMSRHDLVGRLSSLLQDQFMSQKPPKWYFGTKTSPDGTSWVKFKDADGVECAALCDIDNQTVVTLVKKRNA